MHKYIEYALQCEVVKILRQNQFVVFSIPNERNMGVSDMVRMRASGLTKGAPDLICYSPTGVCWWLELKTPKGKRSPEQMCMENLADDLGVSYQVVRSVDDLDVVLDIDLDGFAD